VSFTKHDQPAQPCRLATVSIPVWLIRLMSLLINPVLADLISLLQDDGWSGVTLTVWLMYTKKAGWCGWCTSKSRLYRMADQQNCGWSRKISHS